MGSIQSGSVNWSCRSNHFGTVGKLSEEIKKALLIPDVTERLRKIKQLIENGKAEKIKLPPKR